MTAPAISANQSSLESALREVQATLAELLAAADEQYAAVAAHDRDRIESVTRKQERLSARLARAEKHRIDLLGGATFSEVISTLPEVEAARVEALRTQIASAVSRLKTRQRSTASLLAKSIELTHQTMEFLQRILTSSSPVLYGARGLSGPRPSLMVDGRA
jgi:flagellar biosynthesis/type III secretory pathway chaperone